MRVGDVVKWQHRTGGKPWLLQRGVPEASCEIVGTVIRGGPWDNPVWVRAVVDGEVRLFRVFRYEVEVVREAGKPPSKVWGVEP